MNLDTVLSYLSGLRAYYIDRHMTREAFDAPRLAWIIKGRRRLFPHQKKDQLPITKGIFQKLTEDTPQTIDEINMDTAFEVAWADFMRLGEITYTNPEAISIEPSLQGLIFLSQSRISMR